MEYTSLGTTGNGAYRRWIVEPIDVASDNYFGIKPSITAGGKHYAPFYADFPFSFASTGMKAYYVSKIDGNIAVLKEVTTEVIPASTPLLIECSSTNQSDNRLNLLTGTYSLPAGNLLKGVYFCNEFRNTSHDAITAFNAETMRVWNVNAEGKLVLNDNTANLHTSFFTNDTQRYLNANQSYLPVSAGTPSELEIMTEEDYNNREVAVTALSISQTEVNTIIGSEPIQLTITVAPANATNKDVTWTTSDATVATVDQQGLVTLKAVGQAVITATATDGSGVSASCKLTIEPVLVSQLTAAVEPANATNQDVTWTSSNTSVATVAADGTVTAVAAGTANISVKATDASGITATCTVTVTVVYELQDVTHDGAVDTQDVLAIYEHMQSADPDNMDALYDINHDGTVDTQDVLAIYEYMMGK